MPNLDEYCGHGVRLGVVCIKCKRDRELLMAGFPPPTILTPGDVLGSGSQDADEVLQTPLTDADPRHRLVELMAAAIDDHPILAQAFRMQPENFRRGVSLQLAQRALKATRGKGGELHPWSAHLETFEIAYQRANKHHGHYESVMAALNAMIDEATP